MSDQVRVRVHLHRPAARAIYIYDQHVKALSVTFGAQWEEFTSLHHAADWLAAHGVRVSASTLYAMYYRWEGTGGRAPSARLGGRLRHSPRMYRSAARVT
eukprot:COSAG06_NODE_5368_length_3522_cov_6.309962_4_plen_100_part_00